MKDKIVEHIKSKYNPISIILFGSRVSGNAGPNSDWDIIVFVDSKPLEDQKQFDEIISGVILDLEFIVLQPFTDEFILKTFGTVIGTLGTKEGAEVLFDDNSVGKSFLVKVQGLYTAGRNLSENEKKERITYLSRRIAKLQDNQENQNLFFYHLGFFYEKAVQYWFELKHNKWSPGPKIALVKIKLQEPSYFELLDKLSSDIDTSIKVETAKEIHALFIK